MGKIKQLDDRLSNKIAAGEVVERPASIVKELAENAIDAKSTHILIEIEEGGLRSIRIVDNGEGMDKEDVQTAFLRHATSKIATDHDLFHIRTLGFRGEALPSIASVSHLSIKTGTGSGVGTELKLEGGRIIESKAAATRKGTEIFISQLFYNTPARLKYLKTVSTETGNISDIVNRLALAHPHISFECYHESKLLLKTSGNGDRQQVMAAIYGRNVATNLLEINGETLDYHLEGYVSKPEITRASRQYVSLIVNGRYIKNYALTKAIQQAYHTLLPIGRFPIVVLVIEMAPLLVDVNVHPAKLEVRLSKEAELSHLITDSIKKVFQKQTLIPEATLPKKKIASSEQMSLQFESYSETPAKGENELLSNVRKEAKIVEHKRPSLPKQTLKAYEEPLKEESANHEWKEDQSHTAEEVTFYNESSNNNVIESSHKEKIESDDHDQSEGSIPKSRVPTLYPVGQVHGTYIIAQNDQGMYLIDQHAAQERIKYEYYREKVKVVDSSVQELLVPITIECTNQEKAIITDNLQKLETVGIFVEDFGMNSFIVRSHPTWFPKGLEEETVRELIDQLFQNQRLDIGAFREEAAILMSCKAAIKANRHLRQDELFSLLETLRTCDDPFTCPHGRPIFIHFSTYELEKMFKRVM
ncbi:DNA mismatch repair protein MutL [Bacillus sp. TS-2]|nr:DNA mismatch repair protein MutL [Bacillus sp. TS-2]